jgi:hypothetical protein
LSHAGEPRPVTAPTAGGPCAVVLDNDAVRALRCKLSAGQSAELVRPNPFLRVVVSGDRVEWRGQGVPKQVLALDPGATTWHEQTETGTLVNVGKQSLEALDIEWK